MKATTEKTKDGFIPVVSITEEIKLKIKDTFPCENVAIIVAEQKIKDLKDEEQIEI